MAERRMFAKTIIDSDAFLDMSLTTQALYFHLSMRADDDGFINNPKKIMRMIGASDDDIKLLILKKFIITFDSGVIVIKHWKIHNYIQKDRYTETVYSEEKQRLEMKKNKGYSLVNDPCIQDGYSLETQVSIGKSKSKVSIEKDKESFASLIAGFSDDPSLLEALNAFVEMRKKGKGGFTVYALKLALNKLRTLSSDPDEQTEIVNTTVMSGWKSFYELKDSQRSSYRNELPEDEETIEIRDNQHSQEELDHAISGF